MKPTSTNRWKDIKHCQQNATQHGAYSAQVFSTRAFLRTLDDLLTRLEAGQLDRRSRRDPTQ